MGQRGRFVQSAFFILNGVGAAFAGAGTCTKLTNGPDGPLPPPLHRWDLEPVHQADWGSYSTALHFPRQVKRLLRRWSVDEDRLVHCRAGGRAGKMGAVIPEAARTGGVMGNGQFRFGRALALICIFLLASGFIEAGRGECTKLPFGADFPLPTLLADQGLQNVFLVDLDGNGFPDPLIISGRGEAGFDLALLETPAPHRIEVKKLLKLQPIDPGQDLVRVEGLAADFNGDHRRDLAVRLELSRGQVVQIFLGGPDDTFSGPISNQIGQFNLKDWTAGDYSGSGRDGLVVSTPDVFQLYAYDESSNSFVLAFMGWANGPVSTFDENRDGYDDLVTSVNTGAGVNALVFYGDPVAPLGVGARVAPLPFPALGFTVEEDPGGSAPIYLAFEANPDSATGGRIHGGELAGTREAQFIEHWVQAVPPGLSRLPKRLDLNGDRKLDLVFENDIHSSGRAGVGFHLLWGRGDAPLAFGHADLRFSLAGWGDFDEMGQGDLLVFLPPPAWGEDRRGRLSFLAGQPDGTFDPGQITTIFPSFAGDLTLLAGDCDGDGVQDLVEIQSSGQPAAFLRGRGDGSFEPPQVLDHPPGWLLALKLVDLDRDGKLDLIAAGPGETEGEYLEGIWRAFGRGAGQFDPWEFEAVCPSGRTANQMEIGDLDGDQQPDIVMLCHTRRYPTPYEGYALLARGRTLTLGDTFRLSEWMQSTTLGDIDGDGRFDLVYSIAGPEPPQIGRLYWRRALGEGRFGKERAFIGPTEVGSRLVVTDLDGDSRSDLLVINRGSQVPVTVFRGDGAGGLVRIWSGPAESSWDYLVQDMDLDGRMDLIEVNSVPGIAPFRIWRGDGAGSFFPASQEWLGGPNGGGVIAPLVPDGGPDILSLQRGWSETKVSVLRQRARPMESDAGPPLVSVLFSPDVDHRFGTPLLGQRWRVAGVVEDSCTPGRLTQLAVELPFLSPGLSIRFLPDPKEEFRFYFSPRDNRTIVFLLGPDEAAIRARFQTALAARGVDIQQNSFLFLTLSNRYGTNPPVPGDLSLASFRLTHTYQFADGRLDAVQVTQPSPDISVRATGVDQGGRSGLGFGSFLNARNEYCASAPEDDVVCP